MSPSALPRSRRWPFWLLALVVLGAGLAVLLASRASSVRAEGEYVVVKHTFYLSDDGSVAMDEDESSVAAQYVVNAHRWQLASLPLPVYFNATGEPGAYNTGSLIQNGINTWNGAGDSSFRFRWAGPGSGGAGACGDPIALDGQNTVTFQPLPGLILGQTCTVWNVAAGPNARLAEFDMQLDNDGNLWSATETPQAGRYDIASTILHELGHSAGLGHASDKASVMYESLASGVAKRTLTVDDISGLRAAYPPIRARTMSLARD